MSDKNMDFESKVRQAFQFTANACGGDILQCCIDCGEEPVIPRDVLYDYLGLHGGPFGKEVYEWVLNFPGSLEDLEKELNSIRIPKTWV